MVEWNNLVLEPCLGGTGETGMISGDEIVSFPRQEFFESRFDPLGTGDLKLVFDESVELDAIAFAFVRHALLSDQVLLFFEGKLLPLDYKDGHVVVHEGRLDVIEIACAFVVVINAEDHIGCSSARRLLRLFPRSHGSRFQRNVELLRDSRDKSGRRAGDTVAVLEGNHRICRMARRDDFAAIVGGECWSARKSEDSKDNEAEFFHDCYPLTAHLRFNAIHFGLRNLPCADESLDAGWRQAWTRLAHAKIERRGLESVLPAELLVVVDAVVLHFLGDCARLRPRRRWTGGCGHAERCKRN